MTFSVNIENDRGELIDDFRCPRKTNIYTTVETNNNSPSEFWRDILPKQNIVITEKRKNII